MLRRRIFSGAMASVMALSSVAVVASAEETQVKTKADLEKLVNETYGDEFRTDKLSEYGSVSAEAVLDALEAADAILADTEADAEDYTVAYMMVEATVSRLVIYTAEELQALIDDSKAIYEENNILNEELQDNKYTPASFEKFVEAYENACDYVTSSSSVDITEAFEQLNKAKNDLSKLTIVSKSMFRSVMKQYEALIADEYKYEEWRRGVWGQANNGYWTDLNSGNFWVAANTTGQVTFGVVWNGLISVQDDITAAYKDIDAIKTLTKTSKEEIVNGYKMAQDAVAVYGSWAPDTTSRATKSGVSALLKDYHGCLVYDFNYTSAASLYDAILAIDHAGKGADDKKMEESEVSVTKGDFDGDFTWGKVQNRIIDASWTIKPTVTVYVPVDADGYWTGAALTTNSEDKLPTGADKWQRISANSKFDIFKLIKVSIDNVKAGQDDFYYDHTIGGYDWANGWKGFIANNPVMDLGSEWPEFGWAEFIKGEATGFDADGKMISSRIQDELAKTGYSAAVNFKKAYELALKYLAASEAEDYNATIINQIDTTGVIANNEAKGNSKEWALVYRYLKYALSDRYDAVASNEKYTKADVKALIEKAYDLADLTGDAAIFDEAHMALVNARQDAIEWVKEANADKTYKEYTTEYLFGDAKDKVDTNDDGEADTEVDVKLTSTGAYKRLNTAYEALEKAYNAMKYSFGDIYEKLAEVSEMIDDGELEATTALLTAMDDTAYALSVVSDDIVTSVHDADKKPAYDENPGFDVDRVLQAHNRLITHTDTNNKVTISKAIGDVACAADYNPSHFNLLNAYEALLAEITAQTAPQVLLGDVDGNGTVNALDAAALLQAIVADKALDLAVADYDKSGTVNALDASAILIAIVNGTV